MKLTFHYLNTLALAFLALVGVSSCANLDEENLSASLNSAPLGSSAEAYKDLSLILPDNQVLENPFGISVYYGDDYEKNCMQILCYTFSDELPVPKGTSFSLFLKVPNLNKLKAGQSLDIFQSQLSWGLSSNGGDYQSYIPNGASVIVREATDDYIDLYVDHLKFVFTSGFHMKNGDYTVFGDIRFWRKDINPEFD